MTDYDFTSPIGELLSRDHGKSRGSGMAADELGIPNRLWIRDRKDCEGTQGIYYFFAAPDDTSHGLMWTKVDELRTQWLEPQPPLGAPLPRSLAEIPLKRAKNRRWKERFADDPMLPLFRDREGREVSSSMAGIACVVTPEGDTRILGFKASEFDGFTTRLAEKADLDPDFSMRGLALSVTKSGKFPGTQISVEPVKRDRDGNKIDERIDMDSYEPVDLAQYLADIRRRAEQWVEEHSTAEPQDTGNGSGGDGLTVDEKRDLVRRVLETDEVDPDELIAEASDLDNATLMDLMHSLTGEDQGGVRRVTLFKRLKAEIG